MDESLVIDIKILYENITNRMREVGIAINEGSLSEFLTTEELYVETETELIKYHRKKEKKSIIRALLIVSVVMILVVGVGAIIYFKNY